MNILITNHCPRKCSFCFARSKTGQALSANKARQMSLEQLDKIMDFLERSGDKQLRLLGGEPTCHTELAPIIDRALARGFQVHLFSNCMMPAKVADYLASLPADKVSLLANVSISENDTLEQKKRVEYALSVLGKRVQLGITVISPDFEYRYLLYLIDRYQLRRRIRVGIAQPIVGHDNAFLPPEQYRTTGKALVQMALECEGRDVLIGFDCGLTLCMFDGEDFAVLARCSEGFKTVCQPILDVGPDMNVWHCFPLSDVNNLFFNDFQDRQAMISAFREKTLPYRSFGCMPECRQCVYLRRGQCTGGCLAHAMNSFPVPEGVASL
jgi:radical SAM protein with 4Fe4S-binding SPASM domain